jgi:hypothetical protein
MVEPDFFSISVFASGENEEERAYTWSERPSTRLLT